MMTAGTATANLEGPSTAMNVSANTARLGRAHSASWMKLALPRMAEWKAGLDSNLMVLCT